MIGKGNVGTALGSGLQRVGHEIRYGHRDPDEPVGDAATWGDVIVVAVPYSELRSAAIEIGKAADGKPLVDVTNALGPNMQLAVGFSTSAAEELQGWLPNARVVKAFNTIFAQNQSSGKLGSLKLSAFVAGDDPAAKRTVMRLATEIGFEPVDVGGLNKARYLEPMGILLIGLGFDLKMGTHIGLNLVKG